MRRLALALLLAAAGACAGADRPDPPPPGPSPGPPLPRSSVAAVLLRAEALGLDAAQVDALQAIDADLTARLAARTPPPPVEVGGARRGKATGADAGPRGGTGGGPPGGGMGGPPGGGMGGPPGGGMGGGMGGPPGGGAPPAGGPTQAERIAALEAALDDEDTRAFLRAEAVLRPEQREAAREIASEFRAARYDRRRERRPGRR